MRRAYYESSVIEFLSHDESYILGKLTKNNRYSLNDNQRNAWIEEVSILKRELTGITTGNLFFEYTIPRIGKRIDTILIYKGFLFLLEFKVGGTSYPQNARDQVIDYALDLKNFHKESQSKKIVPILISTKAKDEENQILIGNDGVFKVISCNGNNLRINIENICRNHKNDAIDPEQWRDSVYMPTPTIIEAAQALYRKHDVRDISRSDGGAINLKNTSNAINRIIEESKKVSKKSICFVTGVPGAGKTLAGLNIANERNRYDKNEHAVFLSGNQPLVTVLQEALARDESFRLKVSKAEALKKSKTFIQLIHHFRDDAISAQKSPIEKIAVFDEAQRAWDESSLKKFMLRKKGIPEFKMSEPEFLISIMNRHDDWASIICLVGGGQEINTGEAGLKEWFDALKNHYPDWEIYISDKLGDSEYIGEKTFEELTAGLRLNIVRELHLSVSIRSFRSEKVSEFIKNLLDVKIDQAVELYSSLKERYPIVLTRNLGEAKKWIKQHARGTERYGMLASSGGKRLRSSGIWVQSKIEAKNWFLNGKDDVRSSYFLEDTATEFDIQGLELDWAIISWDANFRFDNDKFCHYNFKGAKWQKINDEKARRYLKNSYRVLLTRARQGMVIFVPNGDANDYSRENYYYDNIYNYLKKIGIEEI